ncbi:S9 family peptidase [Labilibaculum sp. K2S]|uniref:S9 family peptidase n=1 Tax=Labilibaculum sp. K2S TaxID=3056386 RepID=UPI0025A415AA|nr:S9 family peptidase [Labilibaculum sp. K2S]MDM8161312.1 S9 family peptidase [Labilibaculum sp. K2S]
MKRYFVPTMMVLLTATTCSFAQKENNKSIAIENWLQTDPVSLQLPAFHSTKNMEGKTFELQNLLQDNQLEINELQPAEKDNLKWNGENLQWNKVSANAKGFVGTKSAENSLLFYASYFSADEWLQAKLIVEAYPLLEVYIDGEKKISHYEAETDDAKELSEELTIEPGKHSILVKVVSGKKNDFKLRISPNKNWTENNIELSLSPQRSITIHKVLDGENVQNIELSSDGKLALLSYSRTLPPSDNSEDWKEIQEIESGKILHSFRGSQLANIQWLPAANQISYTKKYNEKTSLFVFDFENGRETEIASNIADFSDYNWTPDGKQIIYSVTKDNSEDWKIRKIQGMEDRLPWFRTRSFLYKLDVASGVRQRLTYGTITTGLQDISPNSKYILFSQSRPDYTEYPYEKQNLYQMNLETFEIDTVWKDKLFGGSAQYSPDGSQLLVQAGPSCFGKLGENIGKQPLANNYDGQLYIFDLKSKKAEPITIHFDPSVSQAVWNKRDNNIYLKANDQDYIRLYRYQLISNKFNTLQINSDVVGSFSLSADGKSIACTACSISSPYKAFVYELASNTSRLIADPQKKNLKNVEFGKTEDWNFTKEDGKTIIGRVYYPPNFDSNKKYPVIVNYYAGTSPVERSYGGRYPLNLYAAMGYVVYLLQPSGAVGFGQEFSAEHQNNWGITTADEIIEGTKKFLKAHSFADADRVGCIGASYGGFMTMLLQTRTDIFVAAISHAGISDITSYWGEGYWGYSYSVNASGKSFPWNNRKLYIDQSPLFNANKIVTPMLLIHGSVDTNVPLGESIQMYQALKLLGKDVDFVQVKNQDHHIKNYTQRILWNNTIFAYFAKHLKDQPQWWEDLYPDKNL